MEQNSPLLCPRRASGGLQEERRACGGLRRCWNCYKELEKQAKDCKKKEDPFASRISHLAVGFALYEKAASLCGNLVFIWATVVLLGGFATTLETIHFWIVTILLFLEGVRIFCRSNEVTPTSRISWITNVLFCMQVLSALASIVISSHRLSIGFDDGESDVNNRNMALLIFYILCEIDASLVLLEKFGWIILFLIKTYLLLCILRQTDPDPDEFHFLRAIVHYFYSIYYQCMKKSIFEGSNMEFFSYIGDLVKSSDGDEQVTGVHTFQYLLQNRGDMKDTLIRTMRTRDVMERLNEMSKWSGDNQEIIKEAAKNIISQISSPKYPSKNIISKISEQNIISKLSSLAEELEGMLAESVE